METTPRRRRRRQHLAFFALLAFFLAFAAEAFTFSFPGPSRDAQERPEWPFRPPAADNARGQPPAYQPGGNAAQRAPGYPRFPGAYPWAPPPGSTPWAAPYGGRRAEPARRQTASQPPRLELEVAESQPYVMQNMLVRARLISDRDLATATPEPPSTDLALWERLAEPRTRFRDEQGRQEVVTEFILVLTPLRVGDIEIPPLKIVGKERDRFGQAGRAFEVEGEPIELQVRPAMSSVTPWLPLTNLTLRGSLDRDGQAGPGDPVTLILEINATGAAGDQLPSLETKLREAELRVYREQALTSSTLSTDERRLQGQRTEYYTLIPERGRRLQLPEIELAWWNVATDTREVARMPIRTLGGMPGPGARGAVDGAGWGAAWMQLWLPLAGVLLLLIGYWIGVWYHTRAGKRPGRPFAGLGRRIRDHGREAGAAIRFGVRGAMRRSDPRPAIGYLRNRIGQALPPGLRLALAVQAADREPTPAAWYERLQALAWPIPSHVQRPTQPTLSRMVDRLTSLRPDANRARIERLLKQLEGALYGGQDIDFPRWKRQFRHEVGLASGRLRPDWSRLRRAKLPPLNPQPPGY